MTAAALAGWEVVWRYAGLPFLVDVLRWEDASHMARDLAECGREDVLVAPMEIELSDERQLAIRARLAAAIAADEAEARARGRLTEPLSEAGG